MQLPMVSPRKYSKSLFHRQIKTIAENIVNGTENVDGFGNFERELCE